MADRWYAGSENPASRRLTVQRPGSVLRGTVDTPRQTPPSDLILILGGAGRLDTEGNTPARAEATGRMLHSPYARLSERLAARGYTVARFQRTPFAVDGAPPALEERVEDCLVLAAALRQQTGAARLVLLGHGEGGLVALAAARELEPDGLVLLETPAKPMDQLVADQLLVGSAEARRRVVAKSLSRLRERLLSAGDDERVLWLGRPLSPSAVRALRSRYSLRPVELARGVSAPALVVQGTADSVVGPDNGPLLAAALGNAELHMVAQMTYGLTLEGGAASASRSAPLHPVLLWTLLSWLERLRLTRREAACRPARGEVPA